MSHNQRCLTANQKRLSVLGYARKYYEKWVPIPLLSLMLKSYNELLFLRVYGRKRDKFLSSKDEECFGVYNIKYTQDLSFDIAIFPNCKGHFVATMAAVYESETMTDVSAKISMFIEEADLSWNVLLSGTNEAEWPDQSVPLSKLSQFEEFTFGFFIDVDWVKKAKPGCFEDVEGIDESPLKLSRQFVVTNHFDLESRMNYQSKTTGYKSVGWPLYQNEDWNITLYPKGFRRHDDTICDLVFKLLRWPHDLKSMDLSIRVLYGTFDDIFGSVQIEGFCLKRDERATGVLGCAAWRE